MANVKGQGLSVELDKKDLCYLLDRARGAVGRQHPYFLLDFFLARRVTCAATDLKVGILCEIDPRGYFDCAWGGAVCLSADKFSGIVHTLPEKTIRLTGLENRRLQINCGDYSGVIACVDPDEHFPVMDIPGGAPDVECDGTFLSGIYNAIGHAIGQSEGASTSGLNLRAQNDRICGAATDGHRLSVAAVSIPYSGDCEQFDTGVTISPRALAEIKKLGGVSTAIRFRDNHMSVEQTGITILARLFESQYPDYRRCVPVNYPYTAVVNSKELINVIDRVSVLIESDGINLRIRPDHITVAGSNSAGDISDSVACEASDCEVDICITPRYLLDALKSLARDSEDVVIKYRDPDSAVILLPTDHSNWDERLEVIMVRRS